LLSVILFVMAAPALGGGPITSGSVVSGNLSSPSYSETWTFSGTNGSRVLIGAVTTSGSVNTVIRLKNPSGTEVVNTSSDLVDYQLLASGTYTIIIEDAGLNDAGTYNLSLLNVTAGPLTSGSDLDGGAIASAAVKAGQMNQAADLDAFTFSGTAGQRILFAALTTTGSLNTSITLYPPGGGPAEAISYSGDRLDWQLAATGTYTVVISDYYLTNTGTYSVTFLNVTAGPFTSGPDPDGGAIASAEVKAASFQTAPDFDAFTFTGTANQRVLIDAVNTSGSSNTEIYLYPPSGGAAVVATSNDLVDYQLLASGTYTVVIEDAGLNDTGTYNLSLLNVTAGPLTSGSDPDGGAIASAAVKAGQMNQAADLDAFTFSGVAGQRILFAALTTTGSLNTSITLYPPGGGPAEAISYSGDRLDWQLAATGTYTVVISDYYLTNTGTYSVTFLNVTAGPFTSGPDPDGGAIASAEVKAASFQTAPDFDAFTFTGTANQRVLIDAVNTSGSSNTEIYLYPPSGGAAVVATSNDLVDYQLLASGTYTIIIEDAGLNDTGTYNVSLLNVTAGPLTSGSDLDGGAIASAAVKTGQMNQPGDLDAFTFSGTAGQRIVFAALATGGSLNTSISLYPPNGGPAEAISYSGDRLDWQLVATGVYTAVVGDYYLTNTGSYSVTYQNLASGPFTTGSDLDGGVITSGAVKLAQFQTAPDLDAWIFSGSPGDTAIIGATITSGAGNTEIWLYPPGGGPAVVSTSGDNVTYVLTSAGIHTLLIEDSGLNDTGNYTLTFRKSGAVTGVAEGPSIARLELARPSPNPFSFATHLELALPAEARVCLRIFDVTGAAIRTLAQGALAAGRHEFTWDGRDATGALVPGGIYYAELRAGATTVRRRLVRVR
jgi:hypothetical protein